LMLAIELPRACQNLKQHHHQPITNATYQSLNHSLSL
jgi:hypothetical protein